MIYLLWFSEDRSSQYWAWSIIGCFSSTLDAMAIADQENYPRVSTGFIWGGANAWKSAGVLDRDRYAADKGIGAWYIQEVLIGAITREPSAHPSGND